MNYLWAFCVGGAICLAGQLLIDLTSLTPARILTGYVVAGVVLSAAGWYEPLAQWAGCRGHGAAAGVWASAGQGGAHSTGAAGSYGDLDRGAYRSLSRDHRLSGVRGGVLLAGQQP